jgi:hypothetical protein
VVDSGAGGSYLWAIPVADGGLQSDAGFAGNRLKTNTSKKMGKLPRENLPISIYWYAIIATEY